MNLQAFRDELIHFYWHEVNDRAEAFRKEMYARLDAQYTRDMNGYQRT